MRCRPEALQARGCCWRIAGNAVAAVEQAHPVSSGTGGVHFRVVVVVLDLNLHSGPSTVGLLIPLPLRVKVKMASF